MSKAEILAALARLDSSERREVRTRLDELDGFGPDGWLADGELSEAEKRTIEQRLAELEKHPDIAISWTLAEEELKRRHGE